MKSSKSGQILLILIGLCISLMIMCANSEQNSDESTEQLELELNSIMNMNETSANYTFFKLSFQINETSPFLLMITVDCESDNYVQIYTDIDYPSEQSDKSEVNQYPTEDNSQTQCQYKSFGTCVVLLPQSSSDTNETITVYIGVGFGFHYSYSIMASVEESYFGHVNHQYTIDFSKVESGLIILDAEQVANYEQVIVQMSYSGFDNIGKFALYAGINEFPNTWENRLQSKFIGATSQLLILEPLEDSANSSYFIVIQGQKGTSFNLEIKEFSTSVPSLQLNQTVFYYSYNEMSFQKSIESGDSQSQTFGIKPLYIDINAYGGYGQFDVNYCSGLTNLTFQNINGQSGQIIISAAERQECYDNILNDGGLLVQNIVVGIANIAWYFSFSIGLYEGDYPLSIDPYMEKLGTLLQSEISRTYQIDSYLQQNLIIRYKTISGSTLNYLVYQCSETIIQKQSCSIIINSQNDGKIDQNSPNDAYFLNLTNINDKMRYTLEVSHNNDKGAQNSEYLILILPQIQSQYPLSPERTIVNIVYENEYQYYIVNLTTIKKQNNWDELGVNSIITISLTQNNGECILITSTEREYPTYNMIFESNPVVKYVWDNRQQYKIESGQQNLDAIYIAVLGSTESLYSIQVTIDKADGKHDTPESYTKLVSDMSQTYLINADQSQELYLSYTAHSVPYSIMFSPLPSCVKYGYSLPIQDDTCRTLPTSFTKKTIYIKISNPSQTKDNDLKFSVYIYTGSQYLWKSQPVLISCQDECYKQVNVFLTQQTIIVQNGMGNVFIQDNDVENTDNVTFYSNEQFTMTCEEGQYPCFRSLNASLPYGGKMTLFYASNNLEQIEWLNKPLTFSNQWDIRYFYTPIFNYGSINTAVFFTDGIAVKVYYNIYKIQSNITSAINYALPNTFDAMRVSTGNKLRRIHIVEFDPKLIEELQCENQNGFCIATLAVQPIIMNMQFSADYVSKSVGYYSRNTFSYYIPLNKGRSMSNGYSLIYLTHTIEDSINGPQQYFVKVQPLSSCRPQIFGPSDNNSETIPYFGSYTIDTSALSEDSDGNKVIKFTIATQSPCQYIIWLLESDIKPVISNLNYELKSNQQNTIALMFSYKNYMADSAFIIQFNQQMNDIMFKLYERYQNGTVSYPDYNNNLAINYSDTLTYTDTTQDNQEFTYLITATTMQADTKVNMKISTHNSLTILTNNQKTNILFSQQSKLQSLRYFSNNDFLLFVATNSGKVRITVTDYQRIDYNIIDITIDINSQPWIKIDAISPQIRQYLISFQHVIQGQNRNLQQVEEDEINYPKIILYVEEYGTIGLPKLFEGIALFDSFYEQNSQNCYKYVSETLIGREDLNVDLIFGGRQMFDIPKINYRATIQSGILESSFHVLPSGYRLKLEFLEGQTYQICFSLDQEPKAVNMEFYVMIENTISNLKHITVQIPISEQYPKFYQIYEYVATKQETVLVQVVNCVGQSTLLGSNNYFDIYSGQISALPEYWNDQSTTIAKTTVEQGYYYFGLKMGDYGDKHKIRIQLLNQGERVFFGDFSLPEKSITKVKEYYDKESNTKYMKVTMPRITSSLTDVNGTFQLQYFLMIDDITHDGDYRTPQLPSSVFAKCPILASTNRVFKEYLTVLTYKDGKTDNIESPEMLVPINEIPQKFNLTGFVQVLIFPELDSTAPQIITYYYESTGFKLNDDDGELSAGTIIFIITLILGGLIGIYILYRRFKGRVSARVAFQMATYNHQTVATKINSNKDPIPSDSPTKKTIRRALNSDVGYGEFVDQSM